MGRFMFLTAKRGGRHTQNWGKAKALELLGQATEEAEALPNALPSEIAQRTKAAMRRATKQLRQRFGQFIQLNLKRAYPNVCVSGFGLLTFLKKFVERI